MVELLLKLAPLAATSTGCLTLFGAFFQFNRWFVERFEGERQYRENLLSGVLEELKRISIWTNPGYSEDSEPSPNWYNPHWSVNEFEWDRIKEYNRSTRLTGQEGEAAKALNELEESIETFYYYLKEHRKLVSSISNEWKSGILKKLEGEIQKKMSQPTEDISTARDIFEYFIPPDSVLSVPGITLPDREVLKTVFSANKDVHVKGIGSREDLASLYSVRNKAEKLIIKLTPIIKTIKAPGWLVVGRIGSWIFFVIGLIFLGTFLWGLLSSARGWISLLLTTIFLSSLGITIRR